MRFKVAKQDLMAVLQVVTPSMSSSGNDIKAHYMFRRSGPDDDGNYGVDVCTYSGLVFSSGPVKAVVEDPGDKGKFTVEGKRLKQWLQHVPDEALSFVLDDRDVVARAPSIGKQTFQSFDADPQFIWDKTLKDSKVTAKIEAERLAAALDYSRLFIMPKDSSDQPELSLCEVKKGILYSTDKKAIALIRVEGLAECSMRIHGRDVPGFLTFLGTFEETEVEILEHDRMLVFRRADGAIFGESRFQSAFPGIQVSMDDKDHHQWILSKVALENGIGFLKSGADWQDVRLQFTPGKDGDISLSMMSLTGTKTELQIPCESSSTAGAPEIPPEGFALDHTCLSKVLGAWEGDAVCFGLSVMGNRGLARFASEHAGDKYLTILGWLR